MMRHRQKAIDSVTANELLNALKTLENINIIQDQLSEDLNISFSQKDNFNETLNINNNNIDSSTPKNKSLSKSKLSNKQKLTQKQAKKMDFQFYMSKKDNNKGLGLNLKKTSINKSVNNINAHNINSSKMTKSQIKDKQNYSPIKSSKVNIVKRNSVSPLTERTSVYANKNNNINSSVNQQTDDKKPILMDRKFRLKTQADQKTKKAAKSSFIYPRSNTNRQMKENKKPKNEANQQSINANTSQKKTPLKDFNHLSMHQRTIEFLKNKNQKLDRMQRQKAAILQQSQKQCTFKPKIISTNSVKPKYLQFVNNHDQKKHQAKQLLQYQHETIIHNQHSELDCSALEQNDSDLRNHQQTELKKTQTMKKDLRHQASIKTQRNKQNSHQHHHQLTKSYAMDPRAKIQAEKKRPKYKNTKFNILLDMIQ